MLPILITSESVTLIDFHQVGDGSTNPAGIPEGALAGPENGNHSSNGIPLIG